MFEACDSRGPLAVFARVGDEVLEPTTGRQFFGHVDSIAVRVECVERVARESWSLAIGEVRIQTRLMVHMKSLTGSPSYPSVG
jgi:hypothetical protein